MYSVGDRSILQRRILRMSLWRCLTLFYFTCFLELNLGDQYTLLLGGFPTGDDDYEDYTTSIQIAEYPKTSSPKGDGGCRVGGVSGLLLWRLF